MKINSIYTICFVCLIFVFLPLISLAHKNKKFRKCEPIGRTIRIPSIYLCKGQVYGGEQTEVLCFSNARRIILKNGEKLKECNPVDYSEKCNLISSNCPATRGDKRKKQILVTSGRTYLSSEPVVTWTKVSRAYYRIILKDYRGRVLVDQNTQDNHFYFDTGEVVAYDKYFRLSIFAFTSDSIKTASHSQLIHIIGDIKKERLISAISELSRLQLPPNEYRRDKQLMLSSVGVNCIEHSQEKLCK